MNRGAPHHVDRYRQIFEFSRLRIGTITPTDFDMVIELHGKAYIIGEFKTWGRRMDDGQQLCIERTIDRFTDAGWHAVAFLCWHRAFDPETVVDAAGAVVIGAYRQYNWRRLTRQMTLRDALDWYLNQNGLGRISGR